MEIFTSCNFNPRSREGSDAGVDKDVLDVDISIHAPAKGATFSRCATSRAAAHFNPRSREGSDVRDTITGAFDAAFQSTLPRRERRRTFDGIDYRFLFQSTLPRRERPVLSYSLRVSVLFQSTLPRRERRQQTKEVRYLSTISIHAPAKGATRRDGGRTAEVHYFNPRSREGSDVQHIVPLPLIDISIHAPAKGATLCAVVFLLVDGISIHAPAKGATLIAGDEDEDPAKFQSTLPRRERPDCKGIQTPFIPTISIHAPAKGATSATARREDQPGISIHAPAKGATLPGRHARHRAHDFNPRSREGSDREIRRKQIARCEFQSTLPRRERRIW